MSGHSESQDRQIIRRYTDQPERLPEEVRTLVEADWDGEPVLLYAMIDLDGSFRLAEAWLVLGPEHLALVVQDAGRWWVRSVLRGRVEQIHESPGLSGTTLTLLGLSRRPGPHGAEVHAAAETGRGEGPVRTRAGHRGEPAG